MPSWIFTHIDPLPDLVISCRKDFGDFRVSRLPDESNPVKNEDIFHQSDKQEYYNSLISKKGLIIENPGFGTIKLRLKGWFRKKLIIEQGENKYSGMKIS